MGGLVVLILLALVPGGYIGLRAAGIGPARTVLAQGAAEREPLLLAELAAAPHDSLLARALTEALRVDLSQSSALRVTTPAELAAAVRRMGRDPAGRLTDDAVLELARREGISLVLAGELGRVGPAFHISAHLRSPGEDAVLASFRGTARDSTKLLAALSIVARQARERAGESLTAIRRTPGLPRVTTASLAALQLYAQAVRAAEVEGRSDHALRLLDEAIRLDPEFASAHRMLGLVLHNTGQDPARRLEAITRAYELRDRLPERERYRISGTYHRQVQGDRRAAAASFEALLELDPRDRAAGNLAVNLWELGEHVRAEQLYERLVQTDATPLAFLNLATVYAARGRTAEAAAALAEGLRRHPTQPLLLLSRAQLLTATGDLAAAEGQLAELLTRPGLDPPLARTAHVTLAAIASAGGRLRAAERHHAAASAVAEQLRAADLALVSAVRRERVRIQLAATSGAHGIDAALAQYPLAEIPAANRPYLLLAAVYAEAGRPDLAEAWLAERASALPATLQRGEEASYQEAVAHVLLARGEPAGALAALGRARERQCQACLLPLYAAAHLAAGAAEDALHAYEAYLASRDLNKLVHDPLALIEAHVESARLLAESDANAAARHRAAAATLWRDADEEVRRRLPDAGRRFR
jgi:eukaryotic-like serine/threonine-protein kinase